jgi:soluble lytic murein transglycosylase-like protein
MSVVTRRLAAASAATLALGIVTQASGSAARTPVPQHSKDTRPQDQVHIHVLEKPTKHFHEALQRARREQQRAEAAKAARDSSQGSSDGGFPTPESVGVSSATLSAIAACESGGDPTAVSPDGAYHGLYQFDYGTWASVGGSGDPAAASAAEQNYRAALLYSQSGSSPWPICGQ